VDPVGEVRLRWSSAAGKDRSPPAEKSAAGTDAVRLGPELARTVAAGPDLAGHIDARARARPHGGAGSRARASPSKRPPSRSDLPAAAAPATADAARARRKRTEKYEKDGAETEAGAFGPGLGKSGGGVEGGRSRIAMDAG